MNFSLGIVSVRVQPEKQNQILVESVPCSCKTEGPLSWLLAGGHRHLLKTTYIPHSVALSSSNPSQASTLSTSPGSSLRKPACFSGYHRLDWTHSDNLCILRKISTWITSAKSPQSSTQISVWLDNPQAVWEAWGPSLEFYLTQIGKISFSEEKKKMQLLSFHHKNF